MARWFQTNGIKQNITVCFHSRRESRWWRPGGNNMRIYLAHEYYISIFLRPSIFAFAYVENVIENASRLLYRLLYPPLANGCLFSFSRCYTIFQLFEWFGFWYWREFTSTVLFRYLHENKLSLSSANRLYSIRTTKLNGMRVGWRATKYWFRNCLKNIKPTLFRFFSSSGICSISLCLHQVLFVHVVRWCKASRIIHHRYEWSDADYHLFNSEFGTTNWKWSARRVCRQTKIGSSGSIK